MTHRPSTGGSCCVCRASDARSLVEVQLVTGHRSTLCGSHAVMHARAGAQARSESELRAMLQDRRGRRERRDLGDELGAALVQAFREERRERDRRRA